MAAVKVIRGQPCARAGLGVCVCADFMVGLTARHELLCGGGLDEGFERLEVLQFERRR